MSQQGQPGVVADVETWFANGIKAIENFLSGTAWPFLKTFFLSLVESEITMLQPLAEEAVKEVEAQIGTAFSNPGDFLKFLNAVVANLLQKAEASALQVAESSIVTAAQAAIANLLTSKSAA